MENVDTFEFFECFTVVTDWMRTQPIRFGGVSFTFMDFFIWILLANVVIWFIREIRQ